MNWDAVVDQRVSRTGLGIILRDDEGAIHLTTCNIIENVLLPVIAEAESLRYAMFIARDLIDPCNF